MNRRTKILFAALTVVVLCLGTYATASAIATRTASTASTASIRACSTSAGYLSLASHGKCLHGASKVSLARSATAPKALALKLTGHNGQTEQRSVNLIDGTTITGECIQGTVPASLDGYLKIVHADDTQIDGTSFVVTNGGGVVLFNHADGRQSTPSTGAASVYAVGGGSFEAFTGSGGEYAAVNTHLVVTVPGAVYTVDAVVDVNDDPSSNSAAPYCRVSAMVQSAAT